MGIASSSTAHKPTATASQSRQASLERALNRCSTTQDMLKHSIRSMKSEESALWEEAKAFRVAGDKDSAADSTVLAKEMAADIGMVRAHRATINRQQRLIRRQQMTQMLTKVLVDTSHAMSVTQREMEKATAAIDETTDVATRIFEDMAVISDVMDERKQCAASFAEGDEAELSLILEQLDKRIANKKKLASIQERPDGGGNSPELQRIFSAPSVPKKLPTGPPSTPAVELVDSVVVHRRG